MSERRTAAQAFPISAWAIRNPVPVVLLFIGLVIAGLIAYSGLAVKQFPNVQFPVVALRNSTLFVSLFVNTIVLNGPTAGRALSVCDPPSGFVEIGRVSVTI